MKNTSALVHSCRFSKVLTRMALVMALSCTTLGAQSEEINTFSALQSAIQGESATVTVTGNITDFSTQLTVDTGKTLELGDFTLSSSDTSDGFLINSESSVTIKNGTLNSFKTVIDNKGTLSIEGTKFTSGNTTALANSGTLTLKDVIFNESGGALTNSNNITTSGENTFASNITNTGTINFGGTDNISGTVTNASGTLRFGFI